MPLTIPPSAAYQAPLIFLPGRWNRPPPEGDQFVAVEIDWGSYPAGQGVQVALSGNSPVAFSQIVALSVDNAKCGSDIQFVFTDSSFVLQVPAHASGIYPVFTNSLTFYIIATNAGASDVTTFMIHNSMPPPVQILLSGQQNAATIIGISPANGTTQIIAPPTSGTLNGGSITIDYATGASAARLQLALVDGNSNMIWATTFSALANTEGAQVIELSGLAVRFRNGLSLVISGSTLANNDVIVNVYYSTP